MKFFPRSIGLFLILIFLTAFAFALCGDGVLDSDEQCDTTDFGFTTCEKLDEGYIGGELTCNSDCTLNTVSCYSNIDSNIPSIIEPTDYCGDGIIQQNEQCDKTNLGEKNCESLGYASGELNCNSRCLYDVKNCQTAAQVAAQIEQDKINSQKNKSFVQIAVEFAKGPEGIIVAIIIIAVIIFVSVGKLREQNEEKERKEIISKIR